MADTVSNVEVEEELLTVTFEPGNGSAWTCSRPVAPGQGEEIQA